MDSFFTYNTDSIYTAIGIEKEGILTKEQKEIERLKKKLAELGPILPGSISEQWNVCGTPGCRCKDPVNPKKHGPYYQLSFSVGGKSSTMFIKKENLEGVRLCLRRYKEFKALNVKLIQGYVDLYRKDGIKSQKRMNHLS